LIGIYPAVKRFRALTPAFGVDNCSLPRAWPPDAVTALNSFYTLTLRRRTAGWLKS